MQKYLAGQRVPTAKQTKNIFYAQVVVNVDTYAKKYSSKFNSFEEITKAKKYESDRKSFFQGLHVFNNMKNAIK